MIDTLILGPCQHESKEHAVMMFDKIRRAVEVACPSAQLFYKSSYDKANRTSGDSMRGKGLETTLNELRELKQEYPDAKILTDVHDVEQATIIKEDYSDVIDVLQIPAFLSRQTDLIKSCCENDFIVNVKKGQWMAPWDVKGILTKTSNAKEVWITERGTSFGYNTLVNDFTGMQYIMNEYEDAYDSNANCDKFVYDVTHSVQKPGGLGSSSGGNRNYIRGLAMAAAAMGVRSFFMEVHQDPDNAPSDGPNMIDLKNLTKFLLDISKISEARDDCSLSNWNFEKYV